MHPAEGDPEADRPMAEEQPLHRRVLVPLGHRLVFELRFGGTE